MANTPYLGVVKDESVEAACFTEIAALGVKVGYVSSILPLLNKLPETKQLSIRRQGMQNALRQNAYPLFHQCVNKPTLFINQFLKVYHALYNTHALYNKKAFSFFRSKHRWKGTSPSLATIFNYCLEKPNCRSAKSLAIVIDDLESLSENPDG